MNRFTGKRLAFEMEIADNEGMKNEASKRVGGGNGGQGSKWIRPAKRLAIYLRDGLCCAYCGTDLRGAAPGQLTLDHLTPRSHGGDNEATNLVLACVACNSSRGNKSLEEFAPGGALARIATLRHMSLNVSLAAAIIADRAHNAALEAAR